MTDTAGWPRTDMHLHATHYRLQGAREDMTVGGIVRRLESRGYVAAGIVDHLDTNPKHPIDSLRALVAEFRSISSPMALFAGAELDYQGAGITIPQAAAIKEELGLDYCLGAAHGAGEGVTTAAAWIEDHHRRLMGLAACAEVDVIAHPWAEGHGHARRGRIETWAFELIPERYLDEWIAAVRAAGQAIELNHRVLADADDPAFRCYLRKLCASGVPVTVGSDAHSMERIDTIDPLNALLREAGFTPQRLWRPKDSPNPNQRGNP